MIGIIAAMQAEVDALLNLMEDTQETKKDGISFWQGSLANRQIVLMLSGVGKGNAVMSTTILMKNYPIGSVVNIGTAGGLCKTQEVLDIVISDQVVQHDYDTSALDGEEGLGLWYCADSELIAICNRVLMNMKERFHIGLIASGDQFICEEVQLQRILAVYEKATCAEMEAGAIAQVCSHFKVPFVVVRSLSDIAFKEKSHLDFSTYVHKASHRSAIFCKEIIPHI